MTDGQHIGMLTADPRVFQIAALAALLSIGIVAFHLHIDIAIAVTITGCALLTECTCARGRCEPRSALISALSLCLLLRTNDIALAAGAATLAIASKTLIRIDGRHVFNPTALALVIMTSLFDGAWISPGQWGHAMLLGIVIAGSGCLVTVRAARIDTSLAFLTAFIAIVVLRGIWLGDPFAVMLHQLSNGALLIFAFFMISDPRTTPLRCGPRIAFALAVALVATWIEFALYRPNGAILALVICAPLVPLANRLWPSPEPVPGETAPLARPDTHLKGEHHACP